MRGESHAEATHCVLGGEDGSHISEQQQTAAGCVPAALTPPRPSLPPAPRPPLIRLLSEREEPPVELLLDDKARPFDTNTWGRWWKELQVRRRAPEPHLTWHHLRHMFSTDRLENPDIPGPSNQGAAMLMNNTEKQWKQHYTPNVRISMAAAAASDGLVYRHAQLALGGAGAGAGGSQEAKRRVVMSSDSE